eukprot:TRINITY_DN2694_c0_g2_i1.p1 TRINITY_DN2694_c0_g2~~TRINITY_DN2694_c0_g2_i1.p1  ORF type:complete len:112 (-),score=15.69 TRINITY_DN2694_c0_g2_i1:269-604(-)
MTIDEIINGSTSFPGLLHYVKTYIHNHEPTKKDENFESSNQLMNKYFELISSRASGKLSTTATWIRNFVKNHPDYQKDSVITPTIAYDLCKTSIAIEKKQTKVEALLGVLY